MRTLFWYCDKFAWKPAIQTLESSQPAVSADYREVVVAFVHVEPADVLEGSSASKKLLKNLKWLAKKWQKNQIILHSFTHLGEDKAEPQQAKKIFDQVQSSLEKVGYQVAQTPFGFFLDLDMQAKGHPLARIYKQF